ncbi:MAG: ATP-binding protein [Planctomycetaceae bacterium]|nr:ATP-binding protein [Planctomycetaceae bacterium]MCB9952161.1 ATP-binding protein [Planctomycetaceae bacterium]
MELRILPPTGNTRGPLAMESLLRAVHRMGAKSAPLTLLLRSQQGSVGLAAQLPDELRIMFLQELQDAYPGVTVQRAQASTVEDRHTWTAHLRLSPDILSLRTYEQFLDLADGRQFSDPVAGLLAAIRTGNSGRFECTIELSIRPATARRLKQTERIVWRLRKGFRSSQAQQWFLRVASSSPLQSRLLARWLRRGTRAVVPPLDKLDQPLLECWLTLRVVAPSDAELIAQRKLREIAGALGRFHGEAAFVATRRPSKRGFLLTPAEIATLWHPLTASGDTVSRVQRSAFREVEPPVELTTRKGMADETILGRVQFRRQRNQFGIAMDDLRRHLLAIGKTGCGKSTFLLNVVRQQVEANRGVVLFDPHGQLAEEVLDVIPKRRTNDVIYFDASERVAPVGFNPMIGPPGTDPTLVADGVLTSFKNVFGFDDGSAPRLLHIFRNCLLSLIDTPHASLSSLQRLLVDAPFRKTVVAQVMNAAVREFWLTEFNRWNDRDRTQYIASLQNKLGAFTTNERLQRILNCGQGIQLRSIMDQSQVLICNLSKGTFGHDASTLLGSLLLSSLQVAAMSRADIPEQDRTDCVVVIDEFHSYLADGNSTMADALAESRKYRTSYVLSTQMLDQLDPQTLAGVLGNCGSTLCMTVGPRDAEILTNLLGHGLTPDDLLKIPKYHAYLRLLIHGAAKTFSMTTLPPPKFPIRHGATIRRVSRQRWGLR